MVFLQLYTHRLRVFPRLKTGLYDASIWNEPHRYVKNAAIKSGTKSLVNRRSGSPSNNYWNEGVLNQAGLGEKIVWTGSGWACCVWSDSALADQNRVTIRIWAGRAQSRFVGSKTWSWTWPPDGHDRSGWTWLLHGPLRPVYVGAMPATIELWRRLWRVQQVPKTA